ncbi:molybdenum cofactor guanylyltransferase [Sulfobacillus thermosulfidooxidans]|uniref:molybdenum cofactor guanylyltransferase n=1 Tax=Sulfobacillus thermosulfidooxidans TaxID=28034 RepID=UPI0004004948|nr:NTP transferase domain-containing protein [Sulfobacillus thermosulfidooxidans]
MDPLNQRPAIVLAGQHNDGKLRTISDKEWEAEILLQGRPMVEYVVEALRNSGRVNPIIVVGPPHLELHDVIWADVHDDMLENVLSGLNAVDEPTVLIATADIPLLTGYIVNAFLDQADPRYDVVYPVIEKSVVEAKFPDTHRTYVRLKDGTFTGGNLLMVKKDAVIKSHRTVRDLLSHRKSPMRLASDIGLMTLARWLMGNLRIVDAERRMKTLLDVDGKALIFDYPEVGVDVDKPEDWVLADKWLSQTDQTSFLVP